MTATKVHHNAIRGIAFAGAAAFSYALVPNLARFGVLEGVPALEAVCVRTLVVTLVLGLAAAAMRKPFAIPPAALPAFAGQSLATLAVSACYIGSLQYIPVGLSVLIFFTFPVIVVLVSPSLERRRLIPLEVILAASAFTGLAMALGPSFESLSGIGLMLAATAAAGCALQFFTGRALSQHMDPLAFGSLVHLAILPIVIALALASHGRFELLGDAPPGPVTASIIGLGFAYSVGYFCQMSSVKAAPASIVTPFFNLEPVMTTLIAYLFLRESLSGLHVLGAILVIASLLAMTVFAGRRL